MSTRSTWKLTTAQRDQMPALYQQGQSTYQLARRFHVSQPAVYGLLHRRKQPIRSFRDSHLRFTCNESFFDALQSDGQAYWLGFLIADGTIHGQRGVVLSLGLKDREHLERFRYALQATHPVRKYVYPKLHFARLVITSPHMVKGLRQWGMRTPRINRLPSLPAHLRGAFVRGYFDGDGSIHVFVRHQNPEAVVTITGPRPTIVALIRLCRTQEIRATLQSDHAQWRLAISSRAAIRKFREWIYGGATVWLPRKRDRFYALG